MHEMPSQSVPLRRQKISGFAITSQPAAFVAINRPADSSRHLVAAYIVRAYKPDETDDNPGVTPSHGVTVWAESSTTECRALAISPDERLPAYLF